MSEKTRVVPHTRDCSSHWDGSCSCAPRTREELEAALEASHQSILRWKKYVESPTRGSENARIAANVAREMYQAAITLSPHVAHSFADQYPWVKDEFEEPWAPEGKD